MMSNSPQPLFDTGSLFFSGGVRDFFGGIQSAHAYLYPLLLRHERGDFGQVAASVVEQNLASIREMGAVYSCFSVEIDGGEIQVSITTEARHEATRFHLPGE